MIHIVNGDEFGERLRECRPLEGEVFVWREMLDLGPFSPDWDEEETLLRRAAFFEEKIGLPAERMEMVSRYQEQRLDRIPSSSQVVLWYEPDRYGQLTLLYLLTRMSGRGLEHLDWVEIPERKPPSTYTDADLVRLFENRLPLTERHLKQATSAWGAYISPDPRRVEQWLKTNPCFLPDVLTAFRCHLEYFPSAGNGVNGVEELALRKIGEFSPGFHDLFREVSSLRREDGLSDVHFALTLNELGGGCNPLIRLEGATAVDPEERFVLTPLGEKVLAGEEDRIRVCGIDRWLGGVHLQGPHSWRRNGEDVLVGEEQAG